MITYKKPNYVKVSSANVKKVKSFVFSLPKKEQFKYYSLLDKLNNNFFGSTKSLSDKELNFYNKIIKK